jgi:manganese/iron transport system ATP-binding protein
MPIFIKQLPPHHVDAPSLALSHVDVAYDGTPALADVSLEIHRGERVALVGPNGAGKSTLFNVIVGAIKPQAGTVQIYGSGPLGHICVGYVPQRRTVDWQFPVTVRDVVMMGRVGQIGFFRWPGKRDRDAVEQAMQDVNISHLAKRQIGELSGGQQQRVFLARALAQGAELLLLDEPLTGLDVPSQQMILEILASLHGRGITILVATHDLNQAETLFPRVLLLNRRLVGDGPPQEVLTPERLRAAYGSQLHVVKGETGDLLVADTCCSGFPPIQIGEPGPQRERIPAEMGRAG